MTCRGCIFPHFSFLGPNLEIRIYHQLYNPGEEDSIFNVPSFSLPSPQAFHLVLPHLLQLFVVQETRNQGIISKAKTVLFVFCCPIYRRTFPRTQMKTSQRGLSVEKKTGKLAKKTGGEVSGELRFKRQRIRAQSFDHHRSLMVYFKSDRNPYCVSSHI